MSDRRNFLKNLFGITAGSFIAAKAGSEIWQGRDEFEKTEMIKKKIATYKTSSRHITYPKGNFAATACIVSSAWEPMDV